MADKFLAKITRAEFGMGGYDDAMFGLSLTFLGDGKGVSAFEGTWAMAPSSSAKWTVEDQSKHWSDACRLLIATLRDAKKKHVAELVGTPVEVTTDKGVLSSWRVLTEVI